MMSTNSPGSGGNNNTSNTNKKIQQQQQYSLVVQQTNHQAQKTINQSYGIISGADGFHAPPTSTYSGQTSQQSQQSGGGGHRAAMNQAATPQQAAAAAAAPELAKMPPQPALQSMSGYGQRGAGGGGQPPAIYTRNNGSNPATQRSRGGPMMSSPMFTTPHMPQHLMMTQYPAIPAAAFNSQPRQTQSQLYQQHNQVQFNQTPHIQPPGFTPYPYLFPNAPYMQQRPNSAAPPVPTMAPTSQSGITIPPVMPPAAITGAPPPQTQSGTRRKHMIPVIHPDSGVDVLNEYINRHTSRTQSPAAAATVTAEVAATTVSVDEVVSTEMTTSAMTPVVSAISDGPAVDITPKQTLNKKKTTTTASVTAPKVMDDKKAVDVAVEVKTPEPEVIVDTSASIMESQMLHNTIPDNPGTCISATAVDESANANISNNNVMMTKMAAVVSEEVAVAADEMINNNDQPVDLVVNNNDVVPPGETTTTTTLREQQQEVESEKEEVIVMEDEIVVDSNENVTPPPPSSGATVSTDETDEAMVVPSHEMVTPDTIETCATPQINEKQQSTPSPLIQYDEGQWSPSNPEGKRYYTPEQLRKLSEDPRSKVKPDVKFEHILKKSRGENANYGNQMVERKLTAGRGGESTLLPHFALNLSMQRSSGQSQGTYKRVSQQGSKATSSQQGGQKNPSKSGMIHVSLSLREDVKLNETENAWKPSHLKAPESVSEEKKTTEELYKKFRCILNKLTPEKFNVLVNQVKTLKIDTSERLNGCIELVFEKAVSEPNFSVAYAQLCKQISTISVTPPSAPENGQADGQTKSGNEQYMFRKTLLNRCQAEFHTINSQTDAQEERVKRLDEFKDDPEKHEEYKILLDEEERKIRWRSLGTVRFIGELFKSEMLTSGIMNNCISILMNNRHEDSLECLCKLLTTIGQRLDQLMLVDYFVKLQEIVDNRKQHKISSRVRFMIQDLIELKKNKWIPRRPDLKPKTIVQIQKEAEAEYSNQAAATGSYQLNQRERHSRGGGGGGGSGGGYNKSSSHGGLGQGGGGKTNEDGWTTQNAKSNRSTAVDTKKLSVKATNIDQHTPLGTAQTYKWQPQSTNMYQALSDMDTTRPDGASGGGKKSGFGGGTFGKGSTERARYEGRGSHHKSSRENSSTRSAASRSLQAPARPQPAVRLPYPAMASTSQGGGVTVRSTSGDKVVTEVTTSAGAAAPVATASVTMSEEELNEVAKKIRRRWTEMVKEVVEGYATVEQCTDDIVKVPEEHRYLGIREIYDCVLEYKKPHRAATADILTHAVRDSQVISMESYLHGLRLHMDGIEEIFIDVPMIWDFIPEYLGPMILAKVINLKTLAMVSENLIAAGLGGQLLQHLLHYLIFKPGPAEVLELWERSQVKWTDFMHSSKVDEFIAINKFTFLINKDFTTYQSTSSTSVPLDRVHERLKELIVSNASYDTIEEWISANIGTIDKNFIRILTTVVIESCLYPNNKVNAPLLETQCRLLTRYIENKEEFEMQCLFAIQKLILRLEHPFGLMNHIFVTLYDLEVLSSDSFKNWLDSKEEPEGKGVAVKSLNAFFTHLFTQCDFSDDND